jgi:hypothetical protein
VRVSIGQAACNTLCDFLAGRLRDVTVYSRWPEPNVQLPPKAVSIIQAGDRQRLDVIMAPTVVASEPYDTDRVKYTLRSGSYMQPVQLDVWTSTEVDRDDLISELDALLNASLSDSLGIGPPEDLGRDGLLLALRVEDGYQDFVEFWFDEVSLEDLAAATMTADFRATYTGTARGSFLTTVVAPPLTSPTFNMVLK